ncbi:MAG TPA: cupin domain-containing protein [Gaiellaceae bacterium]|nr:cupin domain-containing protein [Gaiellaceae bacterium]
MRRVNIFAPEFDHNSDREGYRWRGAKVGGAMGAEKIGASLYELPDGEKTYPFHFHHRMEEWLVVLEGTPILREGDGEQSLRTGDVVCFPAGPEGVHQVRGPGTVLILSTGLPGVEAIEYPDSGKTGVKPPGKVFRLDDAAGYWEGE